MKLFFYLVWFERHKKACWSKLSPLQTDIVPAVLTKLFFQGFILQRQCDISPERAPVNSLVPIPVSKCSSSDQENNIWEQVLRDEVVKDR